MTFSKLTVVISKQYDKGKLKGSPYFRYSARVVQESSEGPVLGVELLPKYEYVTMLDRAKELAIKSLERLTDKVDFTIKED